MKEEENGNEVRKDYMREKVDECERRWKDVIENEKKMTRALCNMQK